MIEKPILKKLPHWVLTDKHPAFNDIESVTALEMVARLYGKMEELIESFNTYVDQINGEIERFENDMAESWEDFKECIRGIMNDYIATIDTKINMQDNKIDNAIAEQNAVIQEAIEYMKNNLIQTVENMFIEAVNNGEISAELSLEYNETDKELIIGLTPILVDNNS